MKDAVEKFVNSLDDIEELLEEFLSVDFDEEIFFDIPEEQKKSFIDKYYSYLEEFYDNDEFYELLVDKCSDDFVILNLFKSILPNDIFSKLVKCLFNRNFIDYYISSPSDFYFFIKLLKDISFSREEIEEIYEHGGWYPFDYSYCIKLLKDISFSEEETNKLKERFLDDKKYIIFIPEYLNDDNILANSILDDESIIRYIDKDRLYDVNVLKIILNSKPKFINNVIKNVSKDVVISLIKSNVGLLDYIDNYIYVVNLGKDIVKFLITIKPSLIDHISVDDELIKMALDNGYEFDISKRHILKYVFENGISLPIDKWLIYDLKEVIRLIYDWSYLCDMSVDKFNSIFKTLFDYHYNNDEVKFAYMVLSSKNYYCYNENYNKLISNYDLSKYYHCDKSSYDAFKLSYTLDNLPEDIEECIKLLIDLIEKVDNKARVFQKLINYIDKDEKARVAFKYFDNNPEYFISYVDKDNEEVINKIRSVLDTYPDFVYKVPKVLDSKEFIFEFILKYKKDIYGILDDKFKYDMDIFIKCLNINPDITKDIKPNEEMINYARLHWKEINSLYIFILNELSNEDIISLMPYNNGEIYSYINDELKKDFEICKAYLKVNTDGIFNISIDDPNYQEYVYIVLEQNGSYINNINSKFIDNKAVILATKTYPMALFKVDISLLTEENFKMIDFSRVDFRNVDNIYFKKIVDDNLFLYISDDVMSYLLKELVKRDINVIYSRKLTEFFERELIKNPEDYFSNILVNNKHFDFSYFSIENQKVFRDAMNILNANNKINTATYNPVFSYEVVKYIYPAFGLKPTLNIIKYNTKAASVLINEIKNGNDVFALEVLEFMIRNKVFNNDDKLIHYVFREFSCYKDLMKDILDRGVNLSKDEIDDLRKIIVNNNKYSISDYNSLCRYDEITNEHFKVLMNSSDISTLKNSLSGLFGYSNFKELERDFINFDMGNFIAINTVKDELTVKYGKDIANQMWNMVVFNRRELMIVKLLDKIIKTNDIDQLKELVSNFIIDKDDAIDYCDDVSSIIAKKRLMYNMQYNSKLTKIDDIKSPRKEYQGVTIINMDSERFNFLAHRLYSYDGKFGAFKQMLMDDPSLWTRLDGASTLSTSSFSDKGFHFLNNTDSRGVIYLFNDLPDEFMLFMYGRDLYVEHGGHKLEPTANLNSFTSIDGINQSSLYHRCGYNEVAGFREGMMPCAFASITDPPNEETIRAAKYFEVPIIVFDTNKYKQDLSGRYDEAKKEYESSLSIDSLRDIIFNGITTGSAVDDIKTKIDYCLDVLSKKQKDGSISLINLYVKLNELERIVNQVSCTDEKAKEQLARIVLFRKSAFALNGKSREFLAQIEVAHMGESGIMYIANENGKEYLVKPSVDKKHLEVQKFRADIQGAASKLQSIVSPNTAVDVEVISSKGIKLSKQELLSIDKDRTKVLEDWVVNGGELDEDLKNALLTEYVVDFLLCNFDSFVGNFVIDSNGRLRGIDKEQSFRFIDNIKSLDPSFSYIPNGMSRVPIYKYLFERYNNGELNLDFSVCLDAIARVELLPDEEYASIFEEYATDLNEKHKDEILRKILDRREKAIQLMKDYIEKIDKSKVEGEVLG